MIFLLASTCLLVGVGLLVGNALAKTNHLRKLFLSLGIFCFIIGASIDYTYNPASYARILERVQTKLTDVNFDLKESQKDLKTQNLEAETFRQAYLKPIDTLDPSYPNYFSDHYCEMLKNEWGRVTSCLLDDNARSVYQDMIKEVERLSEICDKLIDKKAKLEHQMTQIKQKRILYTI